MYSNQQSSPFFVQLQQQQTRMSGSDGSGDSGVTMSESQLDKTKLIVNYIPQFATEDDLAAIFNQIGELESVRIMRDYKTGYSYGFGFVKYLKEEDAAKAIEMLNGYNFRNKRLKVSYSRPPGQDMRDSNLYITNLPKEVTEEDIDRIFGPYGEIVQRTVLKDKVTGMPRGVAFVRYSKGEQAQAAINNLDGKQLDNAMLPLSVRVAEDHGRQKAQYIDTLNHSIMYHHRGFNQLRGNYGAAATVAPPPPPPPGRNSYSSTSSTPSSATHRPRYQNNRFLGAGDSLFQSALYW